MAETECVDRKYIRQFEYVADRVIALAVQRAREAAIPHDPIPDKDVFYSTVETIRSAAYRHIYLVDWVKSVDEEVVAVATHYAMEKAKLATIDTAVTVYKQAFTEAISQFMSTLDSRQRRAVADLNFSISPSQDPVSND